MGKIEVKTGEDVEEREGEAVESASEEAPERPKDKGRKKKTKSAEEMTRPELIERLKETEQKVTSLGDTFNDRQDCWHHGFKKSAAADLVKNLQPSWLRTRSNSF